MLSFSVFPIPPIHDFFCAWLLLVVPPPPPENSLVTTGQVGLFPDEQSPIGSVVTEIFSYWRTDKYRATLYYKYPFRRKIVRTLPWYRICWEDSSKLQVMVPHQYSWILPTRTKQIECQVQNYAKPEPKIQIFQNTSQKGERRKFRTKNEI